RNPAVWVRAAPWPGPLAPARFLITASQLPSPHLQNLPHAAVRGNPDYNPNLAVISNNPLVRGAMRMFSWFQERGPYRIAAFPDVHSAVSWLEADRGEKLPQLLEIRRQPHRSPKLAASAKWS